MNRTVLSQSNNFIAMRLTNDDQLVVKRLLPDSLGNYAEMLPILDIGEALVVGDASLLPSRIWVTAPNLKPLSFLNLKDNKSPYFILLLSSAILSLFSCNISINFNIASDISSILQSSFIARMGSENTPNIVPLYISTH